MTWGGIPLVLLEGGRLVRWSGKEGKVEEEEERVPRAGKNFSLSCKRKKWVTRESNGHQKGGGLLICRTLKPPAPVINKKAVQEREA